MKIKIAAVAALTLASGLALGLTCSAAPAALTAAVRPAVAADPAAPAVPVLKWTSCHGGFQCATARVPLDYRHPRGAKISIAVIRHVATAPARRLGSLFVNGGGPSAQIDALVASYQAIPAALRARYDIIDFDMRGFGASSQVRCFPTMAAESTFLAPLAGIPYPVGARQTSLWDRTWARFDARCAATAGPLLYHATTADVADDMDLLRKAVGDRMLNYLGLSYATGLGATYANLFPGTVGHMVLDGNLDPVAWTHADGRLPTWLRNGQDEATAAVVRDFLDRCGSVSAARCAFSAGSSARTRTKFATLLNRLHQHPVTVGNPPQTYTDVVVANSVPVSSVAQWQGGAALLQQLWEASSVMKGTSKPTGTAPSPAQRTGFVNDAATSAAGYDGVEQLIAIQCGDSPNPRDLRAYPAAARLAGDRAGLVGPPLAWETEQCAAWPLAAARDRYAGPWNRPTANAILVIGNTGDPVTPYQSSVAMARDLSRARLLTVRGYGHTEFQNPSTCATRDEVRYLLTGNVPPQGTSCPQDAIPFP